MGKNRQSKILLEFVDTAKKKLIGIQKAKQHICRVFR